MVLGGQQEIAGKNLHNLKNDIFTLLNLLTRMSQSLEVLVKIAGHEWLKISMKTRWKQRIK